MQHTLFNKLKTIQILRPETDQPTLTVTTQELTRFELKHRA